MNFKPHKQTYARYAHRWPKPRKEEAEFGRGKKEFIICENCRNVYFDKSWKHCFDEEKIKHLKESKNVKFVICPACFLKKEKKFEGEIIIENIPSQKVRNEILAVVHGSAKQAKDYDIQDRVLKIEEGKIGRPSAARKRGVESRKSLEKIPVIRILTSENQLAVRLAKKIQDSLGRKFKMEITHSYQEDVIRVKLIWHS